LSILHQYAAKIEKSIVGIALSGKKSLFFRIASQEIGQKSI